MGSWLGIDIGKTAVKVALVRTAYRRVTLEAIGSADVLAAGGTAEAIKAAVAMVTGEKGGTGDGIAVGLEGEKVAVRKMTLPQSAQKQIAEVLPFELEALVPFELGESVFDFHLMPKGSGSAPDLLDILAAVARTEDVRARIDLVKGALGVEPERVSVGSFPIANLVPATAALAQGTVLVADLGTSTSELLVLCDGEPVFARAISFGTQGLPGTAPRLAREIRVTLAAYRATGGLMPARVLLCGGGSFVSGAESFLAGELELPVESLPLPSFDVTGISPEQMREFPRFAKSIGLAVGLTGRATGFDLRKGPLAYERGFAWVKEKIPMLAGLGAVILVSFFFTAWAQLHAISKEKDTLEKALATVTKEVLGEETPSAARANELLGQQTAINDEDPLPHADAFDVMNRLSQYIPENIVHDVEELDFQKGHAVVHGIVGTIADAESIAASLRNEACLSDVKITRNNAMVGAARQKYVLEFDVKCPEDVKGVKRTATAPGSASGAAPSATGGK